MKNTVYVVLGAIVASAIVAVPLVAHHAFGGEFDPNRPILLRGAVTKVEWVNPHAWIHLAATATVLALATALRVNAAGWCWLIVAMAAVWMAEALNTAVEPLADAACPDHHPLVGRAKDVAAGGVLLAAIGAAGIGLLVFGSALW